MSRLLPAALVGVCIVLGVLNLIAYEHGRREHRLPDEPRTSWERWQMLDIGERRQLIRLYQRYAGRADAREVLRQAEAYGDLPRERQDQLRALCRTFYEILDSQSPNQQRELLRSPPRARAVFAYWRLRQTEPERLDTLAHALREHVAEPDMLPAAP